MKLIAFALLLALPFAGTEQDKVHGSGKIKDSNGVWIGDFTTSSTGNTLVIFQDDWAVETIWTWSQDNPDIGWYLNLTNTLKVLTTCLEWNIDGCIKWKWTSFARPTPQDTWKECGTGTLVP